MFNKGYEYVYKKLGINLEDKIKMRCFSWSYNIGVFFWLVARTIFLIYLFSNVLLKRMGFEKTIIILVVVFNMMLWYNLKNKKNPYRPQ